MGRFNLSNPAKFHFRGDPEPIKLTGKSYDVPNDASLTGYVTCHEGVYCPSPTYGRTNVKWQKEQGWSPDMQDDSVQLERAWRIPPPEIRRKLTDPASPVWRTSTRRR